MQRSPLARRGATGKCSTRKCRAAAVEAGEAENGSAKSLRGVRGKLALMSETGANLVSLVQHWPTQGA